MQIREVVDTQRNVDTGILEMAIKKNYNSDWVITVSYGGQDYRSIKDAIDAYEGKFG